MAVIEEPLNHESTISFGRRGYTVTCKCGWQNEAFYLPTTLAEDWLRHVEDRHEPCTVARPSVH